MGAVGITVSCWRPGKHGARRVRYHDSDVLFRRGIRVNCHAPGLDIRMYPFFFSFFSSAAAVVPRRAGSVVFGFGI